MIELFAGAGIAFASALLGAWAGARWGAREARKIARESSLETRQMMLEAIDRYFVEGDRRRTISALAQIVESAEWICDKNGERRREPLIEFVRLSAKEEPFVNASLHPAIKEMRRLCYSGATSTPDANPSYTQLRVFIDACNVELKRLQESSPAK